MRGTCMRLGRKKIRSLIMQVGGAQGHPLRISTQKMVDREGRNNFFEGVATGNAHIPVEKKNSHICYKQH